MSGGTVRLAQSSANAAGRFSETEWQARTDLAACYQLADMYGMSDLAGTHISARVPGKEGQFLLNRFGTLFDEVTASSLVKLDVEGRVIDDDPDMPVNRAAFVIHSAIHMAFPEILCVMHTHTRANNAIAMQKDGLLPLHQKAITLLDFVRRHEFEGAALDLDERDRLVRDLGPEGRILILDNHGAMTVGKNAAEAFTWMYRFETACRFQVDGLAGGRELIWPSDGMIAHTRAQGRKIFGPGGFFQPGMLEWPALLRKLERDRGTSYRT